MPKATAPVPFVNFWNASTSTCVPTPGVWQSWQADLEADCCESPGYILGDVPRSGGILIAELLFLCYIFLGVALGADVFMASIEVITSKESSKKSKDNTVYHVRVWNPTVANLTLMALGSSAPEILLSILEVIGNDMNSGELGPSTIVGSAAFNLMIITAVCIIAIPAGETRTIKQLGVFLTTSFYSVLAYIWLLIIVAIWTPEVITIAEGAITCVFMVLLVIQAFVADKYGQQVGKQKVTQVGNGAISSKEAAAAIKASGLPKDATPQQIHDALQEEMMPMKSRAHYRREALMNSGLAKGGGNKVAPDMESIGVEGRAKGANAQAETPGEVDANVPGVIQWEKYTYDVMESGGSVTVAAIRTGGSKGEVSCQYNTKNQKAVAGKDFKAEEGTFTWADGDTSPKKIEITIYDDDEFEKDEEFTVVLKEPTGGAHFNAKSDGGEEEDICTVTILNDDDRATKLTEAIRMLRIDADSLNLAGSDYKSQVMDCFNFDADTTKGKVMNVLTFPWKLLFGILPPPGLCGGWPCFIFALIGIGFQVLLINDFASQMGCQMYIKKTVTAITFVALGTSLPDTFASMQAAKGDKYADNSIGNVTGSNSVNIFLGLGLPWFLGAVYWAGVGASDEWKALFGPGGVRELPPDVWNEWKDTGAFVVESGDLGLSVIVFTLCAVTTISLILVRRKMGRQELGGNKMGAIGSALFLVMLWLIYIIVSCLATYGFVEMKI